MLKHGKAVDINHLHVSLAHAHASVLQATATQHGFRLTGELVSCSACSMAKKGDRAPSDHHTTARGKRLMELIHIETSGPFPEPLGGLRHIVMFADSTSRLQRPYSTRDRNAADMLAVVKRFIADIGVPRPFRSDNEAEYTNHSFVQYCNNLGIRRELTAPYTPQQNGPVESALWKAFKVDTRHVWGFRTSTRTPAWTRSRTLRTRQQRVCGWSHYFGPQSASIGWLPRQMTDDSPPMRSSMGLPAVAATASFPVGLPSSAPTTQE